MIAAGGEIQHFGQPGDVEGIGAGQGGEPKLAQLKVIHPVDNGQVADCSRQRCKRQVDGAGRVILPHGAIHGGAVMRRGQRGHAVNPAVHSSTEEGRNIRWGGIDFLLNAFTCDLCEKPHRSSAKAVAKEVNSFLRPPAGEKRLCICFAIAVVIMSSRVRCAVIHRCSRQLCIKLTGTVPCAGNRPNGSRIAVIAFRFQVG